MTETNNVITVDLDELTWLGGDFAIGNVIIDGKSYRITVEERMDNDD